MTQHVVYKLVLVWYLMSIVYRLNDGICAIITGLFRQHIDFRTNIVQSSTVQLKTFNAHAASTAPAKRNYG